jgi:hypothetical protein
LSLTPFPQLVPDKWLVQSRKALEPERTYKDSLVVRGRTRRGPPVTFHNLDAVLAAGCGEQFFPPCMVN